MKSYARHDWDDPSGVGYRGHPTARFSAAAAASGPSGLRVARSIRHVCDGPVSGHSAAGLGPDDTHTGHTACPWDNRLSQRVLFIGRIPLIVQCGVRLANTRQTRRSARPSVAQQCSTVCSWRAGLRRFPRRFPSGSTYQG